jgi:hypothetical protein
LKYYLSIFIVYKFCIIKFCFVLNFCRLEMVNPDHTTASACARHGLDAASHRRRGRTCGRGVVGDPVDQPIHDDIADEVDTDVIHDEVLVDVGQQTQGGAPRLTAYPGGPDELSLLISYDQHEATFVWNNKVLFIIISIKWNKNNLL